MSHRVKRQGVRMSMPCTVSHAANFFISAHRVRYPFILAGDEYGRVGLVLDGLPEKELGSLSEIPKNIDYNVEEETNRRTTPNGGRDSDESDSQSRPGLDLRDSVYEQGNRGRTAKQLLDSFDRAGIGAVERQAEREGGELLLLDSSESMADSLSALPSDLSLCVSKDTANSEESNASEEILSPELRNVQS